MNLLKTSRNSIFVSPEKAVRLTKEKAKNSTRQRFLFLGVRVAVGGSDGRREGEYREKGQESEGGKGSYVGEWESIGPCR